MNKLKLGGINDIQVVVGFIVGALDWCSINLVVRVCEIWKFRFN